MDRKVVDIRRPNPTPIPQVSGALPPANYQAAQKALAQCVRIDECKSWSPLHAVC